MKRMIQLSNTLKRLMKVGAILFGLAFIKDSGQGSIPIPTNHRNVAEIFTLNKPLATLAEGAMPDGAVSDHD